MPGHVHLLAPQDDSWLDATEQSKRHDGGEQGHEDATSENCRKKTEARRDWRMKICAANPDGDYDSNDEAKYCSGCPENAGFGGKKSRNCPLGCAQRFHDGKVGAAIKDPTDQGREYT
jgi:hypothetical protein